MPPGDTSSALSAMFRVLMRADNTTYVVTSGLQLVRTNEGWTRFALANRGEAVLERWRPGMSILDGITHELREFYRRAFEHALATGQRWEHDYECSSDEVFRLMRMIVYPIGSIGLIVTHSLHVHRPHDASVAVPGAVYEHDGVIMMCASCRRVRVQGPVERWDWVADWARDTPRNTSHGLCGACGATYTA